MDTLTAFNAWMNSLTCSASTYSTMTHLHKHMHSYSLKDIEDYLHYRESFDEEQAMEERKETDAEDMKESDTDYLPGSDAEDTDYDTESEFSMSSHKTETITISHHELLMSLMDDLVREHANLFKYSDYQARLTREMYHALSSHPIFMVYTEDALHHEIEVIMTLLLGGVYPSRSIPTYEHPLTASQIHDLSTQLEWIRKQPQPDQRTTEWYEFRHNLITASSAWKLLDTPAQQNSYIYDKCQPIDPEKFKRTVIDSPFHWGQKYEPLAVIYYENEYITKVDDFGCIRHASDHFIGASPDGINVDPSSPRFGRMLEIKNIVNRKIDGIPKKEYWIQMQLQMEVCQLPECDFLECQFKEYDSYDAFVEAGPTWNTTHEGKYKNAFLMFNHPDESMPQYEYPPWNLTETEWEAWEATQVDAHEAKGGHLNMVIYWYLEKVSCVLVERNPWWYSSVREEFNSWWKIILHERTHGCDHRISKKRRENMERKKNGQTKSKTQGCVLTISTLDL